MYYSFTTGFAHESQGESSLEDNQEAKMKSDSDKAAKIDKDGNKMNC